MWNAYVISSGRDLTSKVRIIQLSKISREFRLILMSAPGCSSSHFHCCLFFFCSREDNLDVEIAASGFTKDLEESFDDVR